MRSLGLDGTELAELSTDVLGRGGAFCFRARGSSMTPAIRDGDTLIIAPVDPTALWPGDVVLYLAGGGELTAHRIIRRRVAADQLIWTARGDAATGPDEDVRADQVLGRVVRLHRGDRILDLDCGARRAAARLWVATAPLGPWFLRPVGTAKRLARWLLRMAIE